MSQHFPSRRAVLGAGAAALAGALVAGRFTSSVSAQSAGAEAGSEREPVVGLLNKAVEPLPDIDDPGFGRAIDRFGGAKVVLLGESTHGTDEF